jgi:hypothetical protein
VGTNVLGTPSHTERCRATAGRLTEVSTLACMAAQWRCLPSGGAILASARLKRRRASFARSRRALPMRKKGAREEWSGSPVQSRDPASGGGRKSVKSAPYLADRGCGRHSEDGRMKAEVEVRAKAVKRSFVTGNGVAALAAPATTTVRCCCEEKRRRRK